MINERKGRAIEIFEILGVSSPAGLLLNKRKESKSPSRSERDLRAMQSALTLRGPSPPGFYFLAIRDPNPAGPLTPLNIF